MILDEIIKAGRVLILGYGREGKSTEKFLRTRFPNLHIDTADQTQGADYLNSIATQTIVIKTPGISPHHPKILAAKKAGVKFTSATQIFFEVCPGKIIGVTGTKGKSTTASLIYQILTFALKDAVLVGNIGQPALDQIDIINTDTLVVFELSSHQLMDLTVSPHIAVLLNMVPEHLDYYKSFAEYVESKLRITQFQTDKDLLIYIARDKDLIKQIKKTSHAGRKFALDTGDIAFGPWSKIPPDEIPLKGQFNWDNIAAAWAVCKHLHLTDTEIKTGLRTFEPLEGRLELVDGHPFNQISFYDDRLATIPEAAIAAIQTLGNQVETIFLGGADRKQHFSELGKVVVASEIKNVMLFPETGDRIWKSILAANKNKREIKHFNMNSMHEAVRLAYAHTAPGKIVLMSNASPSFGLFKDYRDKAEQYQSAIRSLGALRSLPTTSTAATKSTTRKSSPTTKA